MVLSMTYRRPSRLIASGSLSDEEKQQSIHESVHSSCSATSNGIPEALSFDRIISNGTCPPCTVRDFMNYLKHVEHDAENLQFFLWFRDYTSRWAQLPDAQQALAPLWDQSRIEAEVNMPTGRRSLVPEVTAVLKDTGFADSTPRAEAVDPFNAVPKMSLDGKGPVITEDAQSSESKRASAMLRAHGSISEQAFGDAGMKWKPFSAQPYREEISRIISVYLAEGASRELNLSARERQAVLHALQNTTHPSAFKLVVTTVEYSLRKQSHPNFIRWTICNGNRPRVLFARGLGIAGILLALVADLLITLSRAHRAYRIIPFVGWFFGIATLIAAWKGMCVVLHGLHHRHLRPWELFVDDAEEAAEKKLRSDSDAPSTEGSNSYEDEPWVAKYDKRNVIRKIFDREVWVQEPALRQIQDTIFLQAVVGGLVLSCIAVGIFCAVPNGNFF